VVKPSYGLGDDEVARMLQESFSHAADDRDARALAEQQVDADALRGALEAALRQDGDLLSAGERAQLEAGLESLDRARAARDHRALKAAIEAVNRASEDFAARRMDRAIAGALSGRRIDEVSR
jgi:molecular chaperone HscA